MVVLRPLARRLPEWHRAGPARTPAAPWQTLEFGGRLLGHRSPADPPAASHPSRHEGTKLNRTERLTASALVALAAGTAAGPAHAQRGGEPRGRATADSLLAIANERARAGDTTAALRVLERATKVAPRYAPPFYQRGVLLSRTSQLGMSDVLRRREASGHLHRALEIDRNNPFYLMELGRVRLKTPFLRLDAERLFKRALNSARERGDPQVLAEIQWELGLIHERRYMSQRDRRMITGSAASLDPSRALSDWRYVRDFLANETMPIKDVGELDARRAEDFFRAAIQADPSHEGAALGLLGLLYDTKRVEEMASTAMELRPAQPTSARLYFALGLALHRLGRIEEASAVFDTALARLAPQERRDMTGLAALMRKQEAAKYEAAPESARTALDSLFWDVADPLSLTVVNEARVEFLSRVAYADLRFSSTEFDQQGWRTDRGAIVLRYGEPPVAATFAPDLAEMEGQSDAIGRVTTLWWYPATKMRFVFVGPPAMNYAFFASDFRAYAEDARYVAPVRFDNLEEARIDSVPVQVARFRADTGRGAEVLVYADIPTRRMLREVDLTQAQLETGFFVSDGARRRLVAERDSTIVRINARDRFTSRAWARALPAGDFLYRIEAREPASGHAARGLAQFSVERFPAGAFTLSDLLVARRLAPKPDVTPRGRADYLITPNAAMSYAPRDTIFLYWENYGTARDSTGTGRLRVELTLRLTEIDRGRQLQARILGGIADAVGLTAKGDDRVALRYDRTVAVDAADRIPNHLALDLGDAPYGTYHLELAVTDLATGKVAKRQRTITLPRP